ncbi:MAG: T9SS type A sorting domain-containing protein, partial [Pseudomonadota bacterium]
DKTEKENKRLRQKGAIEVLPNPFNPVTVISFPSLIVSKETAEVGICDIKGNLVEKLITNNMQLKTGIIWNARKHPSGIYLLRVVSNGIEYNKELVLMK